MSKKILITSYASDNPSKKYLVKEYPCGAVYENQIVCCRLIYRWVRTTKKFVEQFLAVDFNGQPVFSVQGEA